MINVKLSNQIRYKRLVQIILLYGILVFCSCNERVDKENKSSSKTVRIDSLFEAAVSNQEIPGAVAIVIKKGKEVYHKSFGYQDLESSIAMKKNTIFRLASMTMGLTAIAVLQLQEQGLLSIEDHLSEYIPEFKKTAYFGRSFV